MITFAFILLMDDNTIKCLLKTIEDGLGWGNSETWASRDFEELNILIQEKTKISLSSSTLRRLWGKADYKNHPSLTTLDTLAQFGGFENWKKYCRSQQQHVLPQVKLVEPFKVKRQWSIAIVIILLAVFAIIAAFMLRTIEPIGGGYAFDAHPITHDLPNTVAFTYDAQLASTDSVFIQQSWDATKRTLVNKNKHLFNSIYYKPGFYHAKLTIGDHVVKEHPLLIPTNGWLGLIDQSPVPVYLNKQEFITTNGIKFTASAIANHHISIEPEPPTVEFHNTGNFNPVSIGDFSFSAEVKNDDKKGASGCRQINVILYTTDIPISIPLSSPGCVASISLLDGHKKFEGSDTDLSGFGIDPSAWVKVALIGMDGKMEVIINDKKAFEINIKARSAKILGMGFIFQGSAAIRKVSLSSEKHQIFSDFN
jgi:hypothetical protein